ncbi:type 3 dihydrofolate reductase [Ureibacillus thermophilus]|uniref:Dihydrofolate reductase n=1 Tax=Ureibacillus thermophilus TaxID=367743 RepID=A0A4P6USF0_9BACL|nr:type 3 dihydrofolate reductase [Ureibacillus thermophilus]QBK25984.1 type 3 dihydrofolate reductase [Ureibacillus thermophilus]
MISLIVAHDKNRVIGYNNQMPWHLPGDLKYFKETTMGKPLIMGRKTFESIGRPLPGRRNIVITRNKEYHHEGIEVASSLEEALKLAGNAEEIMVIGGEQIFKLALPIADRLYITQIHHEFKGDTYFPEYGDEWKIVSASEKYETKEGYMYQYLVYERK